MITKSAAIMIFDRFKQEVLVKETWYQHVAPNIKAIVLYGSVAKGLNRDNSDIDILLIVPLKLEERYTTGEYLYTYKNQEINIVLRSVERLRRIAREGNDAFQKEIFRSSQIIAAADHEIETLLEKIARI